jgi:hypothetical protein
MTTDLAISLLRSGTNGEQILRILDTIVLGDCDHTDGDNSTEPTLDAIDF